MRLCCVQSPSEAQTSVCCLNTQHLRQHFLPSQISEGFFGNLQYLHSASSGSRSPGISTAAAATAPPLPIPSSSCKKTLGFKETRGRSTLCPALFETKMNFKAAPTPLALAGRGWNVGGCGVTIPAWILVFHPATHLEQIRAFSMEINSNRGFFVDFRASRLKVSCVLVDFFFL